MGRRVDVNDALPPVELPRRVLNELFAHARETLPEECCGLILGDAQERFRRVVRCRNDMTRLHREDGRAFPLDGTKAFYMNGADYKVAVEQAEETGECITAVYHSHVDSHEGAGVYLSEMDLEYAEHELFPFPEADHLVIAVFDGRVKGLGLFRREGADRPFTGRGVQSARP